MGNEASQGERVQGVTIGAMGNRVQGVWVQGYGTHGQWAHG